jgi:O-acetyl-ADP-ribose deacetylase (regulator of RNase III)
MIRYTSGNLLDAEVDALVNTVNCVGVMGKGIALQFRQAWPENYEEYRRACEHEEVRPGRMFIYETGRLVKPRFIINFPSKKHWKGKSKIEDVASGLDALVQDIRGRGIRSIALPPLGCGNGGLDWGVVRNLIENKLRDLGDVEVLVYEPAGAPPNREMKVETEEPNMSRGRAALLAIFRKYLVPGYELTMLEIQKLAYFLQVAGEPLRLNFAKERFGPYAEQLHHVLQRIEGHFIRGYGDRSRDASVEVMPEAMDRGEAMLREQYPETLEYADRVEQLIEGFETPFGLELLATVHWTTKEVPEAASDLPTAVRAIREWNPRKAEIFTPRHVELAWQRLREQRWI